MRWLTIPQIKSRSKTAKGALKVSYEHWNQLYTATAKELRAALKKEKVRTSIEYCGLCEFYGWPNCSLCILGASDYGCRSKQSIFAKASIQLTRWEEKKGNWHAWKRACKALRDKLGELIEQGTK